MVAAAARGDLMPRWLVTGAGGQLGQDVLQELGSRADPVVACDRRTLDITSAADVRRVLSAERPTVVVNCAAYTAVDDAEADEVAAAAVNEEGPRHLGTWCADHDVLLVHVSTDYVFDGTATSPYEVTDPVAPRSAYGRTKAAGERALAETGARAHVVRTAWLYGAHGANFVTTIARLARERDTLQVVDDQTGSPTWTRHLARGLVALGASDLAPGTWHCTNGGTTTWFGFAREVVTLLGRDPEMVRPTTTRDFPRPAPRPAYSVLSGSRWEAAGLPPMPQWRDALREAWPTLPVGDGT